MNGLHMTSDRKPLRFSALPALSDALGALLLAASLECGVAELLGLGGALWPSLLACLFAMALVVFFTQRPMLIPAALGVCVALYLLAGFLIGFLRIHRAVAGFFRWWSEAFAAGSGYSASGYRLLARMILALPLCSLLYLYFRRQFYLPPLPVVFTAYLVAIDTVRLGALTPALLLFLAGLAVALAKNTAQAVSRRTGEALPASSLQLPAFVAALLLLLLALLVSPRENGSWWSRGIYNLFHGFGNYVEYRLGGTGGPTVMSDFALSLSGYSDDPNRLGGDVEIGEGTVMEISAKKPALLFGAAYDTYTGSGWVDSDVSGSFQYNSVFWKGKRREIFDLDRPLGGSEVQDLYDELTEDLIFRIQMRVNLATVFYPRRLIELGQSDGVNFNTQGELVSGTNRRSGTHYSVAARVLDTEQENFEQKLETLLDLASKSRDPRYEAVSESCLQLPDTLPDSVREFALALTEGCETPYEKARAIERELLRYTYTLEPGEVPEGRDFVDYFLETKAGYCEYFATAMTVLARAVGLPARYCIGYAMESESKDRYIANNDTAHAWTEIYFSGYGWLTFDPTPPVYLEPQPEEPVEEPDVSLPLPPVMDVTMPILPTPVPPPAVTARPAVTQEDTSLGSGFYSMIALFVLVLLALAVWLLVRRLGTKHLYARLFRRYRTEGERLDAAYRRLLRLTQHAGLTLYPDDTITAYAARADQLFPVLDGEISACVRPVVLWRFAQKAPAERDTLDLCHLVHKLSLHLRQTRGLLWYLTHL